MVVAGLVVLGEQAGKRALGSLFAQHAILLGSQRGTPLSIASFDLVGCLRGLVYFAHVGSSKCVAADDWMRWPAGKLQSTQVGRVRPRRPGQFRRARP